MIYGPDDKPIARTPLEAVYNRRKLEILKGNFRFTDWWGPTLYDARGNQIEWPNRPRLPIQVGKPIRFYRKNCDGGAEMNVKPADDPVVKLQTTFPDIWNDLLTAADPDTPLLMYFAFAGLLLERRDNAGLWKRACQVFDDIAAHNDPLARSALAEAFERLWDSDMRGEVDRHLSSRARVLFRRSKL